MLSKPVVPACYQMLTRAGCHLCDEMAALLDAVMPTMGSTWSPVDVDSDSALRERFGDTVPVLLRDGVPVAKVRLDERQLVRIVRRRRG